MPIKDKDRNRSYQTEWQARKREHETPEAKAKRLRRRAELRAIRVREGRCKDTLYRQNHRDKLNEQKRNSKLRVKYGPYWEAKRMLLTYEQVQRTNPIFEVIPSILAEKKRGKRYGKNRNSKAGTAEKQNRVERGRIEGLPMGHTPGSATRGDQPAASKRNLKGVKGNSVERESGDSHRESVRRQEAQDRKVILRRGGR